MLRDIDAGAVDADACMEAGKPLNKPWATELAQQARDQYRELTPSGSGFRVLGTAEGTHCTAASPLSPRARKESNSTARARDSYASQGGN